MENGLDSKELTLTQSVNRFVVCSILYRAIITIVPTALVSVSSNIILIAIFILFLYVLRKPMQISSEYFFYKADERLITGFESFALLLLFSSIKTIYSIIRMLVQTSEYPGAFPRVSIVYMVISAPVLEEIINRGIGIGLLKKYGKFFSVFATSLIFSFMHAGLNKIYVLPVAFFMGILMILTGNILFPIALHIATNGFLLSFSSRNVLIRIFGGNTLQEPWANMPLTIGVNGLIIITSFVILLKNPFFRECLHKLKPSNVKEYFKYNKEVYREFFKSPMLLSFLAITGIFLLLDLMVATKELFR